MGVTIVDTQDTAKIKKMKNFHPTGNCPIRDILCRLGDKWSMLVLITLNVKARCVLVTFKKQFPTSPNVC